MTQCKIKTPRLIGGLAVAVSAVMLGACAAPAPAPAKIPATPEATAASAKSTSSAPATIGKYRRVVRNGQTYYCTQERPTGSLTMQETCLTQAQAEAQEKAARDFALGVQGLPQLPPSPNSH